MLAAPPGANIRTVASMAARAVIRQTTGERVAHVLIWAILATGFTLLVVQYSLTRGKLIVPAHYDDVTYLRDGLSKLDGFYRGGLNGLLGRAIDNPPHSPFSTIVAFAGYALFGVHDWAPYAANGIIIFGLLGFVDFVTLGMRPWQKLAAFLFVLTVPIAAQSVYEFRSDMAVGLLTAFIIVLIFEGSLIRSGPRYLALIGLVLAATLLAKTSVFPITLGLTGAALFAASVKDRVLLGREASFGKLAKSWATILVPALLIPAPFYFRNRHEIFFYITVNALGSNSDIWKLHASLLTHILYYAFGAGGNTMLGRHVLIFGAILAAGAAFLLPRRSKSEIARASCYAFMLLVAYVGPTINPIKDPYLGVCFDFLLILVVLLILRDLIALGSPTIARLTQALLIAMVFIGAWYAKWPMYWGEWTRADVVLRNRYVNDLYQGVRAHQNGTKAKVMVAVSGVFTNADALGYLADKDGLTNLDFVSDFTNTDIESFRQKLSSCQFVVIGDVGNPEDDPNTPYTAMLPKTLPLVRSRPDYTLIATCPSLGGTNYYLFERRHPTP
jgi:hypothetical protein